MLKKFFLAGWILLYLLAVMTVNCYSEPYLGPTFIGTGGSAGGITNVNSIPSSDTVWLEISPDWDVSGVPLLTLTPDDVGSTFTLSSGSVFQSVASALTDGALDYIRLVYSTGFGAFKEQDLFYSHVYPIDQRPIDLQGFVVDSISFYLDRFVTNFGNEGTEEYPSYFWSIEVGGLLSVEARSLSTDPQPSPVPVPATLLLFGSGLVGLMGVGREKMFKKS